MDLLDRFSALLNKGLAFVAGKNRVPIPATGNTALRTLSLRLTWTITNSLIDQELFSSEYYIHN